MKQYRSIDPTYYGASNVFQLLIRFFLFIIGRQNEISDSNQLMRPQPWVHGFKNCQEMPVLNEKFEPMLYRIVCFVKSTKHAIVLH